MKKLILLVLILVASPVVWGQYSSTLNPSTIDLTTNCSGTGTHSCWMLPTNGYLTPIEGDIGASGYNLWHNPNGSLWTYDSASKTWLQLSMQDLNTHQLAVYDALNIFRLESTDSYCGTGPTYRIQYWNAQTSAWVNFTGPDCKLIIRFGQDGTFWSLGLGNANGNPVYEWTTNRWSAYGTQQLLNMSVADATHMCGVSKTTGTEKLYAVTSGGGTFNQFSPQPPTTAVGCSIGKASQDPNYTFFSWDASGAVYLFDYPSSTWKTVNGLVASSIVTRGRGLTWGLQANGSKALYHFNALGIVDTLTVSGSFGGCPIQNCPQNPPPLHKGTAQVVLPNGLNGVQNTQSVCPTCNMNVQSQDYAVGCDPLTTDPSDPCTPTTDTGTVLCLVSGATLLSGGPGLPCQMTGIVDHGLWDNNSSITVYFDSRYFTAGACGGIGPQTTACDVYVGISSWAHLTLTNVSYTNGGVVSTGGSCGQAYDVSLGLFNIPCNPHYPFIVVSGASGDSKSGSVWTSTTHGQYSLILINTGILSAGSVHDLQSTGAHEEGHKHGLGNCGAVVGDCFFLNETQTVMWFQLESDSPTAPTPCDIMWATIYEAFL